MRADTKKRKNATRILRATQEQEWWADQVVQVMLKGKRALDTAMLEIGRLVAETIILRRLSFTNGRVSADRSISAIRSSLSSTLGCAARTVRSDCAPTSSSRIAGPSRRNSWRRCFGGCLLASTKRR